MGHSARGYLDRRSTKELIALLRHCVQEKDGLIIPDIIAVLADREDSTFSLEPSEKENPRR